MINKPINKIDFKDISSLISNNEPESKVLEYKFTFPKNIINLLKNLYAFANSNGGNLIVGVTEHPYLKIVGVPKGEKTNSNINEILRMFSEEGLLEYKFIEIPEENNRVLVFFRVSPSKKLIISKIDQNFYTRIDKQNIKFDPTRYDYYITKKESELALEITTLLNLRESEFLDFKLEMYKIFPKNSKYGLEQRKELLKDILSLINNKTEDNNKGIGYLIIGVGETNETYNGIHKNTEFNEYQTIIQIINEYINPKFNIAFREFFIAGDNKKILIKEKSTSGYDRNLLMKINYETGIVYEIKKDIGNIELKVPIYYPGLSFTRDISYIRLILQEDRERIIKLRTRLD